MVPEVLFSCRNSGCVCRVPEVRDVVLRIHTCREGEKAGPLDAADGVIYDKIAFPHTKAVCHEDA